MSLQKYLPFASRSNECAYLMTDDDRPAIAAEPVYLARDADAALASKDGDLADANHMLIGANNSADAFRRVAEQRQGVIERLRRAVEWLKGNSLAYTDAQGVQWWVAHDGTKRVSKVPDDIADIIIKPASGESNRA